MPKANQPNQEDKTVEEKELNKKQTRNEEDNFSILYYFLNNLDRETLVSIVGSTLLLMITTFFVVMAAVDEKTSVEVLSNAFLLILGYFFGAKSTAP